MIRTSYLSLVCIVLLTGCMASYKPQLSAPVSDNEVFAADLQTCREEAKDRQYAAAYSSEGLAKGVGIGAFGLLGAAGVKAASDKDDDYTKSPKTMVDECMAQKGYPVVPVDHCC